MGPCSVFSPIPQRSAARGARRLRAQANGVFPARMMEQPLDSWGGVIWVPKPSHTCQGFGDKRVADGANLGRMGGMTEAVPAPHCIETLECGVWDTQDVADDLEDALTLASSLCRSLPEDRIRISTPDFKTL